MMAARPSVLMLKEPRIAGSSLRSSALAGRLEGRPWSGVRGWGLGIRGLSSLRTSALAGRLEGMPWSGIRGWGLGVRG